MREAQRRPTKYQIKIFANTAAAATAKSLQSCPTLCDPRDHIRAQVLCGYSCSVVLVDPDVYSKLLPPGTCPLAGTLLASAGSLGPLLLLPRALPPFSAPGLQPRNNPHTCYHRTDFWFGLDGRGRKKQSADCGERGRC